MPKLDITKVFLLSKERCHDAERFARTRATRKCRKPRPVLLLAKRMLHVQDDSCGVSVRCYNALLASSLHQTLGQGFDAQPLALVASTQLHTAGIHSCLQVSVITLLLQCSRCFLGPLRAKLRLELKV